ncbi:MAG: hypothetical protein JJU18_12540 [Oceanicaulis sp.]|nr:hypothetical protein [Oceanicaulis sp.]
MDAEFKPVENEAGTKEEQAGGRIPGWLRLTGFVIAAALIGGAGGWLAGRVAPAPEPADLSPVEARLDALERTAADPDESLLALEERLSALEARDPAEALRAEALEQLVRDAAALARRVTALEEARPAEAANGEALSALEARLAGALAGESERLDALETRLAALAAGEAGDDAQTAAALAPLQRRIGALETRLAELQDETGDSIGRAALDARLETLAGRIEAAERLARDASEAADAAGRPQTTPDHARRALAFSDLAAAASRSGPFAPELAELRRVWPGAPGLQALSQHARTGAPSGERLAASFPEAALREAQGETHIWFGVLRVARQNAAPGPVDAARAALDGGDLADAVRTVQALDGPGRAAAADWLAGAQARLEIEAALSAQRAALQTEAGE